MLAASKPRQAIPIIALTKRNAVALAEKAGARKEETAIQEPQWATIGLRVWVLRTTLILKNPMYSALP